jgi:hypothetical protein
MRPTGLLALALLLAGAPGAASAQAADARAHGRVEVSLSATPILESAEAMVGTAALLNLGGRLAFGVGGNLMLGTSVLESDGAAPDLELRMAYAGLLLQVRVLGSARNSLALRGLVGAGNAKIRLPVVGSEVATDNFGVLEPEVVGTFTLMGPLQLGVGAGYRRVFGVGDLPTVAPTDLMGYTARVRISIGTG